jgi:hypothetical protein
VPGGGGGFNPVASNEDFSTLVGLARTGSGPFNFVGDGLATGAVTPILSTQEGSIECTIPSAGVTAFLMLATVNNIAGPTDATVWFGVQFNNTTWRLIINGGVGNPANGITPTTPAAGDKMRLRKVGVGATAVVVVELILVATGEVRLIWQFALNATVTLYPALQSFGAASFNSVILRIGQAQARFPYSAYNVVHTGDSIKANMAQWQVNYAPIVGTGTTFGGNSTAGWRIADVTANAAGVRALYNAGRTNKLWMNCGNNDCYLDGRTVPQMEADLIAATAAMRSTGQVWDIMWDDILIRAGGMGGVQATIDARNATARAFNALVLANPATYGVQLVCQQQSGIYAPATVTQADFNTIAATYPWQEPAAFAQVHPDLLGEDHMCQVDSIRWGTRL